MDSDLQKAREILHREGCTCVLCKDGIVFKSTRRGVAPLMEFLQENTQGFSAADKVVGKAAAFLYCLLGVSQVYAPVVSRSALAVLTAAKISVSYEVLADRILNRSRDGFCPMESAVEHIDTPGEALPAIRETMKRLSHSIT